MNRSLGIIGVVGTAAYLGLLYYLFGHRLGGLKIMDLNAAGDFLAGAFGPLAILWLVLGFFQQGQELRQNTEALRLQAQELANSVEQQAAMVEAARQSLEHQRRSRSDKIMDDMVNAFTPRR